MTSINSATFEQCRALIDWFWETANTRLEPWGKIKLCGTVENENDLYHDLLRNPRNFKIRHEKAIINDNDKSVLWPEKWPYEILAERRESKYVAFMKAYQNTVVNAEAAKITQEQIDACYDAREKLYPHGFDDAFRKRFKDILVGVDPAWTKGKRSKYSVIVCVGVYADGKRQLIDVSREQRNYDELFAAIKVKYKVLRPRYVIVESNQMQDRLREEVEREAIPTIASFTTDKKNDLLMGIPAMYSLIIAKKLLLPTGDENSKEMSTMFINELLSWPSGQFSDILMAYYFVEKYIRDNMVEVKVINKSAITGRAPRTSRFGNRYSL